MQHDLSMLDVSKKTTKHVRLRPSASKTSKRETNKGKTSANTTAFNGSSDTLVIRNGEFYPLISESKEDESKANDLKTTGEKGMAMEQLLVCALCALCVCLLAR